MSLGLANKINDFFSNYSSDHLQKKIEAIYEKFSTSDLSTEELMVATYQGARKEWLNNHKEASVTGLIANTAIWGTLGSIPFGLAVVAPAEFLLKTDLSNENSLAISMLVPAVICAASIAKTSLENSNDIKDEMIKFIETKHGQSFSELFNGKQFNRIINDVFKLHHENTTDDKPRIIDKDSPVKFMLDKKALNNLRKSHPEPKENDSQELASFLQN